ncbi:Lipoprotein signal peptidase [hydrothermal vent metagenome]|uniref:Lipoprotein signal peptidase n=1 Tax=hydrothermal vent metagenome TaxID=652676 RepID=A0A3B0YND8_9ZZZZ
MDKAVKFSRLGFLLAFVIVVSDQISKYWILNGLKLRELPGGHLELSPIMDFTFVWNRGVSFGLLQASSMWGRILLSLFAAAVVVAMTVWLLKAQNKVLAIALGLIIGGAVGNLIDRIIYGKVVDFINFSDVNFIWVFNIADASINVGVFFILLEAIFLEPRRNRV